MHIQTQLQYNLTSIKHQKLIKKDQMVKPTQLLTKQDPKKERQNTQVNLIENETQIIDKSIKELKKPQLKNMSILEQQKNNSIQVADHQLAKYKHMSQIKVQKQYQKQLFQIKEQLCQSSRSYDMNENDDDQWQSDDWSETDQVENKKDKIQNAAEKQNPKVKQNTKVTQNVKVKQDIKVTQDKRKTSESLAYPLAGQVYFKKTTNQQNKTYQNQVKQTYSSKQNLIKLYQSNLFAQKQLKNNLNIFNKAPSNNNIFSKSSSSNNFPNILPSNSNSIISSTPSNCNNFPNILPSNSNNIISSTPSNSNNIFSSKPLPKNLNNFNKTSLSNNSNILSKTSVSDNPNVFNKDSVSNSVNIFSSNPLPNNLNIFSKTPLSNCINIFNKNSSNNQQCFSSITPLESVNIFSKSCQYNKNKINKECENINIFAKKMENKSDEKSQKLTKNIFAAKESKQQFNLSKVNIFNNNTLVEKTNKQLQNHQRKFSQYQREKQKQNDTFKKVIKEKQEKQEPKTKKYIHQTEKNVPQIDKNIQTDKKYSEIQNQYEKFIQINVTSISNYLKCLNQINLFQDKTLADKIVTKTTQTLCSAMEANTYQRLARLNKSFKIKSNYQSSTSIQDSKEEKSQLKIPTFGKKINYQAIRKTSNCGFDLQDFSQSDQIQQQCQKSYKRREEINQPNKEKTEIEKYALLKKFSQNIKKLKQKNYSQEQEEY